MNMMKGRNLIILVGIPGWLISFGWEGIITLFLFYLP